MHRIDGEGATSDKKFTEGNPTTGTPATDVTADWLNAVQEEIIAVLTEAGITPSKANNSQLLAAILSLISGGGVAVTAAGVSVADAGGYFTGNEVESSLQQLAEKIYTGTINASQIRRQVFSINGASLQTEAAHAENYLVLHNTSAITYTVRPESALNLPVGTAIQLGQGGAGQINVVAGSGVTIYKGASFNARTMQQHAIIVLIKTGQDLWQLGGMLEGA